MVCAYGISDSLDTLASLTVCVLWTSVRRCALCMSLTVCALCALLTVCALRWSLKVCALCASLTAFKLGGSLTDYGFFASLTVFVLVFFSNLSTTFVSLDVQYWRLSLVVHQVHLLHSEHFVCLLVCALCESLALWAPLTVYAPCAFFQFLHCVSLAVCAL